MRPAEAKKHFGMNGTGLSKDKAIPGNISSVMATRGELGMHQVQEVIPPRTRGRGEEGKNEVDFGGYSPS